ncbi:uncharacterized protein LOC117293988 [Asterias rubens]|uniref:uncharacterized protein LOC117293988 n=1 Tax=Asterias rubens TaxID=7604 RepID=UPI0014551650|nr:uncharacterized protein LOC117293988 [Asterias rubens]
MAIINKCCCFNNVRSGSFASGIYTISYAFLGFIYFAYNIVVTAHVSNENSYFITSIVGMIGWGLAFITAIFMMIGVYQDLKGMLIPFIIVKIFIILVQCIILILYIVSLVRVFYWYYLIFSLLLVAIISINIMCLLCVVSQYQELKAGRGTALD